MTNSMWRRGARLLLPALFGVMPLPALAQLAADTALAADTGTRLATDDLRAGQYVWAPDRAPEGPVGVLVSVPQQMMYVFRAGVPIGAATVSTGRRGHSTPMGMYTILQKARTHHSNLYSNAPMPFMQRLTWSGIALHAGYNPGRPASHGCIRMPYEFARQLYGATALGGYVMVTGEQPPSAEEAVLVMNPALPSDQRYALNRPLPVPAAPAPVLTAALVATPTIVTSPLSAAEPVLAPTPATYDPGVSAFDDVVSYTVYTS